jgi:hypothetical protein
LNHEAKSKKFIHGVGRNTWPQQVEVSLSFGHVGSAGTLTKTFAELGSIAASCGYLIEKI